MFRKILLLCLIVWLPFEGCKHRESPQPAPQKIQIQSARIGTLNLKLSGSPTEEAPLDEPIVLTFSKTLDITTVPQAITLSAAGQTIPVTIAYLDNNQTVSLRPNQTLTNNTTYTVSISPSLKGTEKQEFSGLEFTFKTTPTSFIAESYSIGGVPGANHRIVNVPLGLNIEVNFSAAVDPSTVTSSTVAVSGGAGTLSFAFSNENKRLNITSPTPLTYLTKYNIALSTDVRSADGGVFSGLKKDFFTGIGTHTSGLPAKTDDELLTLAQQTTFNYFWNSSMGGHAASGMARERNGSGNTVTTGGSGFGIMAIIVGVERGFVTRADGVARLKKIVDFLETADRFHGAWSHWVDGSNGNVIPFGSDDNGGDLVETSFLIEGLITYRQYLNSADTVGNNLINRITTLYNTVEWDWYRRCDPNCHDWLYWHWSPNKAWVMNFALKGYFEEQITYFLAAASPTHGIAKTNYVNGFADGGSIVTGNTYTYGGESHVLPLATPAPLFWVHYSYLGLNPHFTDDYANYWTQNTNASLINHAYCKANPQYYAGYSDACWGLTASDIPSGYGAQSPGNDNGTITPTAALSSFPYTPVESMKALRFFYDVIGDRIWDPTYGPHDAFNVTENWYASSYLAIDQGPIPVMIENYRTGLLWNLFMSAPEVQTGMNTLNFIPN